MCRGRRENEEKTEQANIATVSSCELCKSEAFVYCQADDAFLCRKCDKLVHGANFLAQRHIRCILCGFCRRLTQKYLIGVSSEVILLPRWNLDDDDDNNNNNNNSGDEDCERIVKEPFLFL
ncbi:hypothetical protein HAX54_008028 [Datura stramonium]|uniref:B box-type domain-containing protein n=1 Tax=Datura stramonium TaxID=4076 RepID=A0ABS8TDD4_DATST|nr:hypothetical protein [Datura stramonium]